ncbi:hypothetical protein LSTR_LSTR005402 [Laodelphax striatellus]|uniref:Phospholipase A2 n=1 Tax=Laodelphax striatellus TaxID=195883 RepID=A0A482WQU5_LAOST|nr:hypothetical protein LSTR_LSTR005402 [Laodelphax striatellus]
MILVSGPSPRAPKGPAPRARGLRGYTGPIVFSEGSHNWTHLQTYIGYTNDPWGESAPELSQHSSALSESTRHNVSYRGKRSVVHLYNIIVCATDCNPLAYKGYGCYCGFLGSGYSMDPIDSCCKMHDWCYTTADCPMFLEYFVPYVWTCYRRRPLCAIGASCGQRLCECDRKLAECLRRFPCPRSKAVCTSSPWRLLQNVLML